MQAIERVAPQVIDGLQFYVSKNGKEKGASETALGLMCGVSQRAISSLLTSANLGGKKGLEHLQGKVFHTELTNESGLASIVTSEAMAAIIEYYAFDSKAANDTAKNTYRKFAKLGIDKWILDLTGYHTDIDNSQMLSVMNTILSEVKELRADIKDYHDIRKVTVNVYPGLDSMLNSLPNVNSLPPSKDLVTAKEWLATKGFILDQSNLSAFGRLVADTFKSMTKTLPPNKITKVGNRWQNVGKGYTTEHYPILETAWLHFCLK